MPSEAADDWDRHWLDYAESAERNPAQQWRRGLIVHALALRAGDRFLDIGSGQGDLAANALDVPGIEVAGLELSESGVAVATRKAPAASFHQVDLLGPTPTIAGLVGWATKLSCSEVLEHLDEPLTFLRNALVHGAPGGVVVVTVPAGPMTAFDRHIGHRRHYDRTSLRSLLGEAGLHVHAVDAVGFPMFNLYRLAVLARGRRLIAEVASDAGPSGAAADIAMRLFNRTMRWSTRSGRLGWQLLAKATIAAP